MTRRTSWALASALLATIIGSTLGMMTASAGDDAPSRNTGEQAARTMPRDGAELVVEDTVCIVTRSGRARGSACTADDASDVMVSFTVGEAGYALGVFDPRQRVASVAADGGSHASSSRLTAGKRYFELSGSTLPPKLRVLDADGRELASFTPATDHSSAVRTAASASRQGH
ncbi:MAG: hypothetical protein LC808_34860 [Actinobacteria bacterium]|nr:hypothetical protein [Actinomycetota bacterium]